MTTVRDRLSMAVQPVELRAPAGARVLEIDWSDGATARYPHSVLRAFCPCAHCQGHQGPLVWTELPDAPNALEIEDLVEVGNYAIRITWGDGHQSGIYSFEHLRALGDVATRDESELRRMRFGR